MQRSAHLSRRRPRCRLRFAGHVGTGFTEQMLTDLLIRPQAPERPTSRSTRRCPATTPAERTGSSPNSWVKSRPPPDKSPTEVTAPKHTT